MKNAINQLFCSANVLRLSVLLFLFCLGSSCESNPVPSGINKLIIAVQKEYAPDKRVALFAVEAHASAEGLQLEGETNLPAAKDALLKRLQEENFQVIDRIELLPANDLAGKTRGLVVLSACNIRSQPKHSGELATQATLGTPLRIYKKQGDWALVQTPDGYLGWLDQGGYVAMTSAEYANWEAEEKVVFLSDFGFTLSAPTPTADPVSDLLAGNILRFLGTVGTYTHVAYPDGREGYVDAADVMDYKLWLNSRQPEAKRILASAYRFLGRPYLWGGTSGKGVDCSGFTKTVFYLNGLLLPRDASQQVHTGIEISTDSTFSNLMPGDLLFFGRKASAEQGEKIVHVAIHLGEGRVIHASGTVKIESLRREDPDFNEYRYDTFVRAKRILNAIGENGIHLLADTEFY